MSILDQNSNPIVRQEPITVDDQIVMLEILDKAGNSRFRQFMDDPAINTSDDRMKFRYLIEQKNKARRNKQ
jgi:hypothetical protein